MTYFQIASKSVAALPELWQRHQSTLVIEIPAGGIALIGIRTCGLDPSILG